MSKLVVMAGLPAVGKSTIARELARRMTATWLRLDSMDQAIWSSGTAPADLRDWTLRAAQAVAADNLRLGRDVVADGVNDWAEGRLLWASMARRSEAAIYWLEVVCSDPMEHRRRAETRQSDVPGLRLPAWSDIQALQFAPWAWERTVIDTAKDDLDGCIETAMGAIGVGRDGP